MPRPLIALPILAVIMLAAPGRAQAQETGRNPVGEAVHRCIFNRPCNWTSHATIGAGLVFGLHRLHVKPEYAAAASALVWVGKELRDNAKWPGVLGTSDSNGDLISGLLGTYVAYRVVRQRDRRARLTITKDGDHATTIQVRLPSR